VSEDVAARLGRLVSSDIRNCDTQDAEAYASDLKLLAAAVGEDTSFRAKERFFKALGDATRLKIVKMLGRKEMCVCEVMTALDISQPTASHHLGILEREGIVEKRREGKWAIYNLSTNKTIELIKTILTQQ
jgi:DNA-binding transcriptional ArsR family regulator